MRKTRLRSFIPASFEDKLDLCCGSDNPKYRQKILENRNYVRFVDNLGFFKTTDGILIELDLKGDMRIPHLSDLEELSGTKDERELLNAFLEFNTHDQGYDYYDPYQNKGKIPCLVNYPPSDDYPDHAVILFKSKEEVKNAESYGKSNIFSIIRPLTEEETEDLQTLCDEARAKYAVKLMNFWKNKIRPQLMEEEYEKE